MRRPHWLELSRKVRFSDTDAAGVMHFQHLLGWCHQGWEESLDRFGINAAAVFPGGRNDQPSTALPIIHCHADYRAPLQVGDEVTLELQPTRLNIGSFEVITRFRLETREVALGCVRHLAIDPSSRERCGLPEPIERWLEASALGQIQPL